MDVNEHERLSKITRRYKIQKGKTIIYKTLLRKLQKKYKNIALFAVLHFTVTVFNHEYDSYPNMRVTWPLACC